MRAEMVLMHSSNVKTSGFFLMRFSTHTNVSVLSEFCYPSTDLKLLHYDSLALTHQWKH